ncbi:lipase 3 [Musca domestica]|uniref:Lipase n=1 Tax=Musca domestica TaxID=7370 RepID=A0A1I8N702_MUSDO|nr:lipase 3 [Musca domestica]
MKTRIILILLGVIILQLIKPRIAKNTCDRVTEHGYLCENHTVTTKDGYLLTMFRIPHSPLRESQENEILPRPAVLLMHGTECSSDMWVLNGPNDGLPFLLANAGYDVWLANIRGNLYSRQHQTLSPSSREFMNFSWDEIGRYDIPAKIDYILSRTNQKKLHYIGFSMGTRIFMITMSTKPKYAEKIKTAQMLGPGVFLCHIRSRLPTLLAPIFGRPGVLSSIFGAMQGNALSDLMRSVLPGICRHNSNTCANYLQSMVGRDSPYVNQTLLADFFSTYPAGTSPRLTLHFLQLVNSCQFRSFDFGPNENKQKYGQLEPPAYDLKRIKLQMPIEMYFSDNDYLATIEDIRHLYKIMGNQLSLHRLNFEKYNHWDFILAKNVKTSINDCVVDKMQQYEGRSFNGSLCNNFRNKACLLSRLVECLFIDFTATAATTADK